MATLFEVDEDMYPLYLCAWCGRILLHGVLHVNEAETLACAAGKKLERERKWLLEYEY